MKKRNKVAQLSMVSGQRKALLKSLAISLIEKGKIRTTLAKARVLRQVVEKKITLAKDGLIKEKKLSKMRILRRVFSEKTTKKLFEWAEVFKERRGGYCRIIKMPFRQSDSAKMALIEMVDQLPKKEKEEETLISKAKKKVLDKTKTEKRGVLKDKAKENDER